VVEVELVDVEVVEEGEVVEVTVDWVVVELDEESTFELEGDFDEVVEGLELD
jgi:hypothetical protein